MKNLSNLAILLLFLITLCSDAPAEERLKLGLSFPPVRGLEQTEFTKKHAKELNIEVIRIGTHWEHVEGKKGQYGWRGLDSRLKFAKDNNLSVLLTVQSTGPSWACSKSNERSCLYKDVKAFEIFVATLLQRYANKIDKVQFGNEWPSEWWYVGSKEDYVKFNNILYRLTKKYSPRTKVVLGGFAAGQLRILASCQIKQEYPIHGYMGQIYHEDQIQKMCQKPKPVFIVDRIKYGLENARYDIVDIHLYDDAEKWQDYYNTVRSFVPYKDIIVSEFGGPDISREPYTDDYHAQRVGLYLTTLDKIGVKEAYHFKLIEGSGKFINPKHSKSGLISKYPDLKIKPAYYVFKEFGDKLAR